MAFYDISYFVLLKVLFFICVHWAFWFFFLLLTPLFRLCVVGCYSLCWSSKISKSLSCGPLEYQIPCSLVGTLPFLNFEISSPFTYPLQIYAPIRTTSSLRLNSYFLVAIGHDCFVCQKIFWSQHANVVGSSTWVQHNSVTKNFIASETVGQVMNVCGHHLFPTVHWQGALSLVKLKGCLYLCTRTGQGKKYDGILNPA